jgi:uncharacterized protein YbaR (Trm112 family)
MQANFWDGTLGCFATEAAWAAQPRRRLRCKHESNHVERNGGRMPISQELLDILVCPETKQPVAPADAKLIDRVNTEIEAGRLRNRGGNKISDPITEGLLREDGKIVYIVDDGIPVMLIEESIEL